MTKRLGRKQIRYIRIGRTKIFKDKITKENEKTVLTLLASSVFLGMCKHKAQTQKATKEKGNFIRRKILINKQQKNRKENIIKKMYIFQKKKLLPRKKKDL